MKTIITIPPEAAAVIPFGQLKITEENPQGFSGVIGRLLEQVRKCPKIRETEYLAEHPAVFHYFSGGTDMYACEFDGTDRMFGYSILNGDLDNAEWGYISLAEIRTSPALNIDYHFAEQSIEAALYLKYPKHFGKPSSLMKK